MTDLRVRRTQGGQAGSLLDIIVIDFLWSRPIGCKGLQQTV